MTLCACGHPTGDHDYRGCEVFVPANDGRCRCPHPNDDRRDETTEGDA